MRLEPGRTRLAVRPGARLGIYAAAAHLGWFQDTFKAAFPAGDGGNTDDTWALEYGKFKNRVVDAEGQPPAPRRRSEFDIVAEWFARGLPRLTTYIAPDTGPTSCTQSISLGGRARTSPRWRRRAGRAVNRSRGHQHVRLRRVDEPARVPHRRCPTRRASRTARAGRTLGTLRVLRELSFNTYYWMRSSADGRFVANGATGGDGAVISDLQTNKDIEVKAAYDPGFFPDNRGWMFQGTPIGARLLHDGPARPSNPDRIDFSRVRSAARVEGVSLYQHLGSGARRRRLLRRSTASSRATTRRRGHPRPERGVRLDRADEVHRR